VAGKNSGTPFEEDFTPEDAPFERWTIGTHHRTCVTRRSDGFHAVVRLRPGSIVAGRSTSEGRCAFATSVDIGRHATVVDMRSDLWEFQGAISNVLDAEEARVVSGCGHLEEGLRKLRSQVRNSSKTLRARVKRIPTVAKTI